MRTVVALVSLALAAAAADAQPRSARATAVIEELVVANRVLAAQGILPGYGHVSARNPDDPNRYFLARSLAPELVTADDIVEFDLDSLPVDATDADFYRERFIHGEIYRARSEVQAVVHDHSPAVIAFGAGATPLRPVTHDAAFLQGGVPIWDYREFGTAGGALVDTPERGRALAKALGARPVVLMRNHGVAIVSDSLPGVVQSSVSLEKNAEILNALLARGDRISYLELDTQAQGTGGGGGARAWDAWKRQALASLPPVPQDEAAAASEVFALEREIGAAMVRGDVAFVAAAIAPDFSMVHGDDWTHGDPARLVDDRASFLKRAADKLYAVIDYETQSAEIHGDVAITHGRYVGNIPSSPPGRRWFYVWYEKVYAKRDGRWIYLSHRSVDGAHYGENREAVSLRATSSDR
jgi:HCOMODA/2-hydroxy-3-carboxy-muconic semialdehyde decarboxylase